MYTNILVGKSEAIRPRRIGGRRWG